MQQLWRVIRACIAPAPWVYKAKPPPPFTSPKLVAMLLCLNVGFKSLWRSTVGEEEVFLCHAISFPLKIFSTLLDSFFFFISEFMRIVLWNSTEGVWSCDCCVINEREKHLQPLKLWQVIKGNCATAEAEWWPDIINKQIQAQGVLKSPYLQLLPPSFC